MVIFSLTASMGGRSGVTHCSMTDETAAPHFHTTSGKDINASSKSIMGDGNISADDGAGAGLEVNVIAENNNSNSSQGEVGPTQQASSSTTDSIVDESLPKEGGNPLQNFDSANQSECLNTVSIFLLL